MDSDERDICNYLKSLPGQALSAKEIARRAAGKWRYREDPYWAAPVLARLVEKSVIKEDSNHYYRLAASEKKGAPGRWVSPQIRKILEKSGKDFDAAPPQELDDASEE